ncbi:hypothetical protein ELG79_36485 [Rhizobium leguminosarum]|uniref:hypothetical protein n=1 Tax=Rhizobium leguminosarum TaxID=384 RepID=UPI00102F713B|nr:hypothetical protein [Rhizobium leguminosarum]TBG08421.1 hypothetical protein ELG79_36485 [Rhizobium leguminosarum]
MPSSSNALFIIGNLAALIAIALLGCLAADTVAALLGYHAALFCSAVGYAVAGAHNIGVVLTTLGILMWALSRFRSETGLGLAIGGVLLAVMPQVLPHYLGVSCILS